MSNLRATLLGIIPFLFLTPLPLAAQNSEARILEMNGRVEIKAPGDETWSPARPGLILSGETLISTGFRSSAILSLGNSRLTVRALTRLSLADLLLSQNQETISVNLRVGRVRAEVNPPPGGRVDFSVRSPSATASVRGTVFEFDTVAVRVYEGSVRLAPVAPSAGSARNAAPGARPILNATPQSVTINAGQTSQVDTLSWRAPPPRTVIPLAPPPLAGLPQTDAGPEVIAPIIETPASPGGRPPAPTEPAEPPAPPDTPSMGTVGIEVDWKD